MADDSREDQQTQQGGASSTLNRDFAGVLASILESASAIFPHKEGARARFSIALVGEMGKDEFIGLVEELPVVAVIGLTEEIGTKAALLIDTAAASALAGLDTETADSLSAEDTSLVYNALNPIIEALSSDCEEATGYPLGIIESIEIVDPTEKSPEIEALTGEFSERLCKAMATIAIGNEESGKIALVLPRDLAKTMTLPRDSSEDIIANEASEDESVEPRDEDLEPSMNEIEEDYIEPGAIDAILGRGDSIVEEAPFPEEVGLGLPPKPAATPRGRLSTAQPAQNIDLILDIQLKLTARLGQMEMSVGEIMKLLPGSVIDIDRFVDEPVELVVNGRPIARGDIVVVQENFGIRISEIISPQERIQSLR